MKQAVPAQQSRSEKQMAPDPPQVTQVPTGSQTPRQQLPEQQSLSNVHKPLAGEQQVQVVAFGGTPPGQLTHLPPQSTDPGGQTQAPATQIMPAGQQANPVAGLKHGT
jgi:hypothetical protein